MTSGALFAVGSRKSKIANVAVPVVQRIEQRFPNANTAFLLELAPVVISAQIAISKGVEQFLWSSRVITNLPLFTPPGDTTGDTTNRITRKRSRFTS